MKTQTQLIGVAGHWSDTPSVIFEAVFGRMPEGYTGSGEDLPYDSDVQYWLEHDEVLKVGKEYGDFIITGVEA